MSNVYLLVLNQEDGVDITANSLHPGTIATNLFRHRGIYAAGKYYIIFFMQSIMHNSLLNSVQYDSVLAYFH